MLAGGDCGGDDDGCSISGSHGVAVMVKVMMKALMLIVELLPINRLFFHNRLSLTRSG